MTKFRQHVTILGLVALGPKEPTLGMPPNLLDMRESLFSQSLLGSMSASLPELVHELSPPGDLEYFVFVRDQCAQAPFAEGMYTKRRWRVEKTRLDFRR